MENYAKKILTNYQSIREIMEEKLMNLKKDEMNILLDELIKEIDKCDYEELNYRLVKESLEEFIADLPEEYVLEATKIIIEKPSEISDILMDSELIPYALKKANKNKKYKSQMKKDVLNNLPVISGFELITYYKDCKDYILQAKIDNEDDYLKRLCENVFEELNLNIEDHFLLEKEKWVKKNFSNIEEFIIDLPIECKLFIIKRLKENQVMNEYIETSEKIKKVEDNAKKYLMILDIKNEF